MLYRQIILEWGQDTESGVWGLGYSPDNGKNFYVLNTTHGRKYRAEDGNRLYPYISDQIQDKIDTVVAPAKSAADSAQSAADAAVASAQVTSDAVSAIASATAEAKQGANDAMSWANSAWDVATGAKEAVTDFDPLLKSAQSDASKALTQIADTASALSDAKTAFGSDVAAAKELASMAQTTANSAVESADENAKALTSQANALSDARRAMDSDIANTKELANTAQATADNAVKSASSVADDLAAVANQAKANASGITKVTSDVGLLQTTVADNSGNISKIQETAAQLQQAVSNNAGNITIAKQTADSAVTVASDAKSNATVAVQTASGASVTAKNAQGDATTAMVTSKGAVTQASDAKSNATIAVQTASEASLTATNAQGDASFAKQTASEASVQIKNAQGDISKLQTRAGTIEASVASNSGAIADVQVTANQLKASVSDNSGAIVVATQTAQGAVTVASDARSNATVANQTASQASITANNASGQAASAVLTAQGALTTASNAESDATVAVQTASGASLTATNAKSDATVAQQTASEATVQASNAESDFAQLSIRANKIEANVANDSGAIASVQQTANGLTNTVGKVDDRVKTIEDKTNWTTKTGSLDMDTLTTTQNIYYRDTNLQNADGEAGWAYIQVVSMGERVTQTVWHDRSSIQHTRTGAVSGSSYNWDAWNRVATYAQVTEVKQTIEGITTTINDPKTGLNATYQTAQGNATTISNVKGDVTQLQATANGLTSRVGNLESKTDTQQTAIEQNKAAIALKADQTAVDTLKGTVSQNTATLTTQADEIKNKVTRSDVTGMLTGYATQDYTQSLVTQKANQWNVNLTRLQTDVNAIKTTGGGVNLWINSKSFQNINVNAPKVDWNTDSDGIATAHITGTGGFYGAWQQIYANNTDPFSIGDSGTFSVEMKGTGTITIGRENDFQKSVTLTDTWTRYSVSGVVNHKNSAHIIYNESGQNCDAYVRLPMVEKGMVSHDWSPAPSDMATVTSVTNLAIGVEGVQAQVYNSDGSSKITQLSNLIATKVSQGDYNSQITQLKNDINLRVAKGDVISQINQEAGGDTLIQVSNGKKSLILDAGNTIITGKAWIPSAAISSIQADQIQIGNSRLFSDDGTFNLINQNAGTASIKLTTGNVQGSTQPVTEFSNGYNMSAMDISPVGTVIRPTLFFEDYPGQAKDTGYLGFSRHQTAELYFHTYDDTKELFRIACVARFNQDLHVDRAIWQQGLSINSGNTIWSGSNFLAIGDHISNSYTNVMARSFSQQSTLSSKTNIETVDPKDALDLVNRTDIRSYQYKTDVAQGKTKRYTSLIIDDVNDVSQYYAPNEFTNEERTGRDDGSAVGYLFLAVQELTRRIKNLEEKLNG